MNQPAYEPYNILVPAKQFSQLVAKSWLENERLTINNKFLVANDILSAEEAKYFTIEVDEEPEPPCSCTVDAVAGLIKIKYAQRPKEVTDEALNDWINSPSDAPPWVPLNSILKIWLPIIDTYLMY